ncbi:MAG: hypothetical protein EGR22_01770, partial [Ruminococcaceae bacterium]|nr:hypothetical protein [Oscillospiraceae bacterium]
GSNSYKTVEYFSKALGEKTIDRDSISINKDRQNMRTGKSISDQIMARALMTPDELRRLDNDLCIIFEKGIKPVKANKFYYFKHPMAKEMARVGISHNDIGEIERGEWRKYNPYNPYARPQQPAQQANPYAQPQQPTQQANPYARPQQPAQQANPYAQPQQPAQQTNPYINNQSTQGVVNSVEKNSADNDFSQPINPYAPSMTASENLVAPKKRSKKPFIIAGVSVVGVAAVAVAGVMVLNMLKPSGGPITKIADSAKQLAKANSATISASVEANGEKTKCDISYELDASKKEIVLVINGSSSYDSLSSSDTFKSVIYCKDGVRKSAITANGNTTYTEIDEETLNNFFDSINKTNAEQELDWNSLLEDADLKDYIDTTKIDAVSNSLKNTFENGNGKEALGIKESAVDNGTKYSFDINTYKTISIIVDEIEPLFKDKSKYNELKSELPEAESYLNSINLKFDITVDNAGYLSGFAFNSFGTKIDFSISKIGNTKVELSESEINDIKNAKATPSTGYIPDKYYDGDNAVDDINQVYDFT